MPASDIKLFIDFFFEASQKIRDEKPIFVRGKDGRLVKSALKIFSRSQLEMMAVWFLDKKRKLKPRIGTMLSKVVLEELKDQLKKSDFWGDLSQITERYYPNNVKLELKNNVKPFNDNDLMRFINENENQNSPRRKK